MANRNQNIWIWLAIGVIVLMVMGYIPNPLAGGGSAGGEEDDTSDLYPSDLKTTITLNTGDAGATTATNANVSYYVFSSDGKFLKEGTTATGTISFTVPTGGNYKLIAYDDTSSTAAIDYNPIEVSFSTDTDDPTQRAVKTVNVDLWRESNATVELVRDPVDLNGNVSIGAGQTVKFDVLISATRSNAMLYKPVIRAETNLTRIDWVKINGLSEVTCPDRKSVSAGRKATCFQAESLKADDGIVTYSGSFKVDDTTAPETTNYLLIDILDTGMYREADYKTVGISAFKEGTENPADDSNVGAEDSQSPDATDHANSKNYLYFGG